MQNLKKNMYLRLSDTDGRKRRKRECMMSESEIMTILVCYHFGTFANFKHYYMFFIKRHLAKDFPSAVSYNRFVELMPRVFFPLMLFMRLQAFGKCSGITFVDSTMIPVCHNVRRCFNKVFEGLATDTRVRGLSYPELAYKSVVVCCLYHNPWVLPTATFLSPLTRFPRQATFEE